MDELLRCRPWIEAALEYSGGTHDFDDIVAEVFSGRMQLWPAERGCLVTQVVVYPKKKMLHIFLGGGELDQLTDMHTDVIAWARAQGCERVSIAGRKGWEKPLKAHGWTSPQAILFLEI